MAAPRIDQVNVVVSDVEAVVRFLAAVGIEVPAMTPEWSEWDVHHREIPSAGSAFSIDLDSSAFAREWGGLPASFTGVVVDVRVDDRGEVDSLYERALAAGGRSIKPPYDAFFGSRFALVEGPGQLMVGMISVRDDAHRSPPPDPASFAG